MREIHHKTLVLFSVYEFENGLTKLRLKKKPGNIPSIFIV